MRTFWSSIAGNLTRPRDSRVNAELPSGAITRRRDLEFVRTRATEQGGIKRPTDQKPVVNAWPFDQIFIDFCGA